MIKAEAEARAHDAAEIEEVRIFRRAARRIVRSPRPRKERLRALVVLGGEARENRAGVLAQLAAWEEAKAFIRNEPPPAPVEVNHPAEGAIRAQLREGRVLCKGCLLPLPPAWLLDRNRRERVAELERRQRLKRAGE